MKNKRNEYFIDACERTMLLWLPIRKSIKHAPMKIKEKFWLQLWAPLLSAFVAVLLLGKFGLFIGAAINLWWFVKWNRYLKNVEYKATSTRDNAN
jgi:uncharacterized membrane protein